MTDYRYQELNGPNDIPLTDDEIRQGWHFCYEFDGPCRNSNEDSFVCNCNKFQNQNKPTP